MKKTIKLITLILSAVLLIGAAIGISVSATTDAPTVEIVGKNLSYEGAIKVLYAVEATNVPEGAKVQMAFFDNMPTSAEDTPEYVKDENPKTLIIGDKECKAFFSEGIAPKDMRKNIYAVPVITQDGEILVIGEPTSYSIYTYATNMFEKSPTEEQKALYTSLLDYGASVQRVLLDSKDYTAEELEAAGGYADEYCGIKLNTFVDGELVEADVKYYSSGTKVAIDTAKIRDSALFNGYTDAKGNSVGEYGENTAKTWTNLEITANKIGVAEYNCNYTSEAYVYTYEDEGATAETYAIFGENTTLDTPATKTVTTENGEYTYTNTAFATLTQSLSDSTALQFSKIRRVTASTDPSVEVGDVTPAGNISATSFELSNKQTATNSFDVECHIFETDFYLDNTGAPDSTPIQFFFKNKKGNVWAWNLNAKSAANPPTFSIVVKDGGDNGKVIKASLPQREWINIRVEIYPVANSNDISFKVFINGEFTGTTFNVPTNTAACDNDADYALTGVSLLALGALKDVTVALDNTVFYTATKPVTDYYGKGLYADNEATDGFDDDDVRRHHSNSNATITEAENGNKVLTFNKATTDSSTLQFPLYTYGDKYIFETDIRWTSATSITSAWLGRFGFTSKESRNIGNDSTYLRVNNWQAVTDGDLYLSQSQNGSLQNATISPIFHTNVWYNLRIEYIPTSYDAEAGKWYGNQYIYVNNQLVYSYENQACSYDNTNCYDFRLGFRGYNTLSFELDNVYTGVEKSVADYYGQGAFYEQSHKYGNDDDGWKAVIAKKDTQSQFANVLEGDNYVFAINKPNDGTSSSGNKVWFNVNEDAKTLAEGESYVFETDFKWLGSTVPYGSVRCATFGFVPTVGNSTPFDKNYFYPTTSAAPSITGLYYDVNNGTNGTYTIGTLFENSELVFENGVWYNIRFVYTPTGSDGTNFTGIQQFYVNNVLVYEANTTSTVDNTAATAFFMNFQRYAGSMKLYLDNTFGGVVNLTE